MKKIRIIILAAAACCLMSCSLSYYGTTRYKNDDISLGDSKKLILKKYGRPYSQELELIDGKTIETLGYKEEMSWGYKMNTFFVFEDGKLIRKLQEEEKPRPEIRRD